MNAIDEIKDENIKQVAKTLRSSGLASSETEAVRMAMMMAKTSQKVTQNFDQRRNVHSTPFQNSEPQVKAEVHVEMPKQIFNIHTSPSVQEKPRKIEEKEEFIFGDVQEKESAQKTDVYKVENEFEEVIVQEVIVTKAPEQVQQAPQQKSTSMFKGRPSMFGSGTVQSSMPAPKPQPVESHAPQHVAPVQHTAPVHQSVSQQMPVHESVPNPSPTPVTAASSAQMAFASLLGDIQKTQHKQEQKPAVQPSPAQASSPKPEPIVAQPAHQPVQQVQHVPVQQAPSNCPRPITHIQDPRANMMKEANVDLTKMFNVNK